MLSAHSANSYQPLKNIFSLTATQPRDELKSVQQILLKLRRATFKLINSRLKKIVHKAFLR